MGLPLLRIVKNKGVIRTAVPRIVCGVIGQVPRRTDRAGPVSDIVGSGPVPKNVRRLPRNLETSPERGLGRLVRLRYSGR
jgi:hypothetical protein